MSKTIEDELLEIKELKKILDEKILLLEKQIEQKNNKLYNLKNKESYIYYLSNAGKKDSSIHSYILALERIKSFFREFDIIYLDNEIYYIDDMDFLNELIQMFNDSADITLINLKHHHRYSAAINNYAKFLKVIK